ncbi:unnamed protein product [Aphanomyces euteiches]
MWILISSTPFHHCSFEEAQRRASVSKRFEIGTDLRAVVWAFTSPHNGQYIRIQLEESHSLHLAQVEVLSPSGTPAICDDGWFGLDTRELGDCAIHIDSHWLGVTNSETRLILGGLTDQNSISLYDSTNGARSFHVRARVPNSSEVLLPQVEKLAGAVDVTQTLGNWHKKLHGNLTDRDSIPPTSLTTSSFLTKELLKQVPIFESISDAALVDILQAFESVTFRDENDVILVGRPRRYFYIIESGTLEVCGESTTQGQHIYLDLQAGSFLGELALISGAYRGLQVVAKGLTKCHRLHRADFLASLAHHQVDRNQLLASYVCQQIATTITTTPSSPTALRPHELQVFTFTSLPTHFFVDLVDHDLKTVLGTCVLTDQQLHGSHGVVTAPIITPDNQVIGQAKFQYLHLHPWNHPANTLAHSRVVPPVGNGALDIGHRGLGRSYYQKLGHRLAWIRENTLPSFIVAGYFGADLIEFDVQLSKDRIPVIYHDFFFLAKLGHRIDLATLFTKMGLHDLTLAELNRIEWRHCIQKPSRLRSLIRKHWHTILNKGRLPAKVEKAKLPPGLPKEPSPMQGLCDLFPTFELALKHVPLYVGFNVEIKYPMEKPNRHLLSLPAFEMNSYVDAILDCVMTYAGTRRIVFSCFAPDICSLLRVKQTKYPVLFLTCGVDISQYVDDARCVDLDHAVGFARMDKLQGIVTNSDALFDKPSLVPAIKNQNLLLYTWGDQNTSHDHVQLQKKYGVDAVISDNIGDLTRRDDKIRHSLPCPPRNAVADNEMEGSKVYVPDDKLTWVPATVMRMENGGKRVLVRITSDDKVVPDRWIDLGDDNMPEELPLQNETSASVEDMCTLNHLHEAAIVYNLKARFAEKKPYTYTGSIVVAINPYAWLDLYSKATQQRYLGDRSSLPPHVYATSASAFQSMVQYDRPQSILVSGESGAGKTETVKILMEHLATISTKNPNLTIVEKVLKSNPLLEAFGNAKTIRNDNSSRFGKFTQLQFDLDNQLVGAKCRHYLLEKSRVIMQSANERNYHIFYQLRASGDPRWHLKASTQYSYLREESTSFLLDGEDDKTRYAATRSALTTIGVAEEDQLALLDALAGILHVGQIQFESKTEDSSAPIQTSDAWNATCELLGFQEDPTVLATSLCNRTVKARLEVYVVPLSVEQAQTNRDALAKELYARLFRYLVQRVNDSISNDRSMQNHIDLLDIFGFEAFETNRFEQFCINFANEKLQQKFTHDVFKTVQEEYEEEGLGWTYVSFKDNQDMLDLLEAPLGVIPLLNEECIRPMGNDLTFCSKVVSTHDANPRLDKQKARLSASHFALKHYAGTVMYNVDGFVETNKDALSTEVLTLLSTSSNKLIQHVFRVEQTVKKQGASTSFMGETVVSKFKTQLTGLMSDIGATQVHYIRCIKPNGLKSAAQFDFPGVIDQLRCAGVVEAIRISRAAFPNKLSHERFLQRFVLFQSYPPRSGATVGAACSQLATHLVKAPESKETFVLGTRHIYFAAGVLEGLEKLRTTYLQTKATLIQRIVRGYLARRRFTRLRAAVVKYQALYRKHKFSTKYQLMRRRVIVVQSLWRGRAARRVVAHLHLIDSVIVVQRNFRKYRAKKQYLKFRQAVILIQAQMKQKAQQAKFRMQRQELQAQQSMEMELVSLKTRLEQEKSARQVMETTNSDLEVQLQKVQQEAPGGVSLLADSGRMLETLQREVQKLRDMHERDTAEMEILKSENKRIKDAYTAAGASFAALNQHNKQQSKANLRLMSTHAALIKSQEEKMKKYQKQISDLKEELKLQRSSTSTVPTPAAIAVDANVQEKVARVLREHHISPDVVAKIRQALASSEPTTSSSASTRRTSITEPPVSQPACDDGLRKSSSSSFTTDPSTNASWAVPRESGSHGQRQSLYYEDDPTRKSGLGGMFKKMFKKNDAKE